MSVTRPPTADIHPSGVRPPADLGRWPRRLSYELFQAIRQLADAH